MNALATNLQTAPAAREKADRVRDLHFYAPLQSDKATAANAALRAGHDIYVAGREAWDAIHADHEAERTAAHKAAAGAASALLRAQDKAYGVASSVACGLYFVTTQGHVNLVEQTTSGSDYLDYVKRHDGHGDFIGGTEWPVADVLVFADTLDEALRLKEVAFR